MKDDSENVTEFDDLPLTEVTPRMLRRFRRYVIGRAWLSAFTFLFLLSGAFFLAFATLKDQFIELLGAELGVPLLVAIGAAILVVMAGHLRGRHYRSRERYARYLARRSRTVLGPWLVRRGTIEWLKEYESVLTVGLLGFITAVTLVTSTLQTMSADMLDQNSLIELFGMAFVVVIVVVASIMLRGVYREKEMANGIADDEMRRNTAMAPADGTL